MDILRDIQTDPNSKQESILQVLFQDSESVCFSVTY